MYFPYLIVLLLSGSCMAPLPPYLSIYLSKQEVLHWRSRSATLHTSFSRWNLKPLSPWSCFVCQLHWSLSWPQYVIPFESRGSEGYMLIDSKHRRLSNSYGWNGWDVQIVTHRSRSCFLSCHTQAGGGTAQRSVHPSTAVSFHSHWRPPSFPSECCETQVIFLSWLIGTRFRRHQHSVVFLFGFETQCVSLAAREVVGKWEINSWRWRHCEVEEPSESCSHAYGRVHCSSSH